MSNFRPQGVYNNPGQGQFNPQQQQQFNQNQMTGNPAMRQQQQMPPVNQQFQGNNNMQSQVNRGGGAPNEWDQFFQQANVPATSNNRPMGGNVIPNQGFNNPMQQQQGGIDPGLKQSLARTVGLVNSGPNMGQAGGMGGGGGGMNMGNMNIQQQQPMQGRGGMNPVLNQAGPMGGGGGGGANMGNMNSLNNMGRGGGNQGGFQGNNAYDPYESNFNQGGGGGVGGVVGGVGGGQRGNFNSGGGGGGNFGGNDLSFLDNPNAGAALDLLNKLQGVVAATGSNLNKDQLQRILQNPAALVGGNNMGGSGGGGGGNQMRGGNSNNNSNNMGGGRDNFDRGGGGGRDNYSNNNGPRSNFDNGPSGGGSRRSNWDAGEPAGNARELANRIGKSVRDPQGPEMNVFSFSGNKRDRNYSPSRSRSNSPSYGGKRPSNRSPPRGGGGGNARRNNSPPRNSGGGGGGGSGSARPAPAAHTTSNVPIDLWHITQTKLIEDFNAPAVTRSNHTLTTLDLSVKFPNLYVPSDFMSVTMDWRAIADSMYSDKLHTISDGVAFLFENTPAALTEGATHAGPEPAYTSLTANVVNNELVRPDTNYSNHRLSSVRPVKFNARVIVTCGVPNHTAERIDFNLPRKLRVLCGRRKGGVTLLGASWNHDLDGGDPITDRSCLLNTARRAVYAQSLLDIFNPAGDPTANLTKLCEINYHRPKETVDGKSFPEQQEITAVYLYTMQPDSLPVGQKGLDQAWRLFNDRVKGVSVGPTAGKSVNAFYAEMVRGDAAEATAESIEVSIDRVGQSPEEAAAKVTEAAAPAPAAAATASADGVVASDGKKPDAPTLFICAPPLGKDSESYKKPDTLALRVTPLAAILGYSLEDRSERMFETSLAGEIVRSLIAVSCADIIVDFFIAEHPTLSSLADIRIVQSIKVLREVIRLMRLEMAGKSASDAATAPSPNGEGEAAGVKSEAAEVKQEGGAVQVEVSEQEARQWRRRFVAACRWFDVGADKFFNRDLTQLIINASSRSMSRADLASVLDRVCKGGRVHYENFL